MVRQPDQTGILNGLSRGENRPLEIPVTTTDLTWDTVAGSYGSCISFRCSGKTIASWVTGDHVSHSLRRRDGLLAHADDNPSLMSVLVIPIFKDYDSLQHFAGNGVGELCQTLTHSPLVNL